MGKSKNDQFIFSLFQNRHVNDVSNGRTLVLGLLFVAFFLPLLLPIGLGMMNLHNNIMNRPLRSAEGRNPHVSRLKSPETMILSSR